MGSDPSLRGSLCLPRPGEPGSVQEQHRGLCRGASTCMFRCVCVQYLVEALAERRCVVIHILHDNGEVGLGLMAGVRGTQGKGVVAALLVVQWPRKGNASPIPQHTECAHSITIQHEGVGECGARVHIVPCQLCYLGA